MERLAAADAVAAVIGEHRNYAVGLPPAAGPGVFVRRDLVRRAQDRDCCFGDGFAQSVDGGD